MVVRSSGFPISARAAYHWAAELPTRLLVATGKRTSTRSGWSIASRMAMVPPRLKPATAALSSPIASISAARSSPSCWSVPSALPTVDWPWPRTS